MVDPRRAASIETSRVLLSLLVCGGCSVPPQEPDPERILAEAPLQRPDGTPLAPFPPSVAALGFRRSEFELSRECEAAGGRLPQSRETWYGPAPEPEPWACLDLPAPGLLLGGRFGRVGARFSHERSCELAFSDMPVDGAYVRGLLVAKYGPPTPREKPAPCLIPYTYDFESARVASGSWTVAWTWRDGGRVLATIVLRQTCEGATLVYTGTGCAG